VTSALTTCATYGPPPISFNAGARRYRRSWVGWVFKNAGVKFVNTADCSELRPFLLATSLSMHATGSGCVYTASRKSGALKRSMAALPRRISLNCLLSLVVREFAILTAKREGEGSGEEKKGDRVVYSSTGYRHVPGLVSACAALVLGWE
jgi:hypothetical protein